MTVAAKTDVADPAEASGMGDSDNKGTARGTVLIENSRTRVTEWYFEHFGRMYISYIAAITAFSAIQNIFGIALVNWISPTVIGTALIVFTNQKYYQKFKIPKRKS